MTDLKLVSHDLCPFVQRSVIVAAHRDIELDTVNVDLQARPDWFVELSPTGKVPMLLIEAESSPKPLFDSTVINEYLDEISGGTMSAKDPLERAEQRSVIELGSAALDDAWRLGRAQDEVEAHGFAGALQTKLARLEAMVEGPMFLGRQLSLVDAALVPLLQRVVWTDAMVPELGLLEGIPGLRAWLAACEESEAVRSSTDADSAARYQQLFIDSGSWVGRRALARRAEPTPPPLMSEAS